MSEFEKQFIILDWTQESLDRAIEKARELWYKEWEEWLTDITKEENILVLHNDWDYYLTDDTKEELINHWYTELKLESNVHYVYVSDISVEDALKEKAKRILITDLGEQFEYRFICVEGVGNEIYLKWENNIDFASWKYISEIPKEEEKIEITTQDWQTLSITKEKAIELWFKID